MLEFLRQLGAGIAQTWTRLSISARANLVLAGVFSLVLVGVLVFYGSQPQYGRLYNGLSADESSEITVVLNDLGIPFQLRDGGRTIEVPVSDVTRARVNLAGQNLPRSQGVVPGFEMFDTRSLMSNRFLDDVDYQRALRGEMQRTLNQLDYVRSSSVFIREAEDALFTSEQRPSEATVIVDTGGKRPAADQIKTIVNIVSSFGGANLNERNIAVSMTDGTILKGPSNDEFASLAGDKLAYQLEYEQQKQNKIMGMFREVGRRAVVTVNATFDWTSEEKKQRQVTEGTEVSTLSNTTTVRDIDLPPVGAPGATANIPAELQGQPSDQGLLTETIEKVNNLEPSETVTTTTTQPGTLKKVTVSALIEGNYTTPAAGEGAESAAAERTYVPLTAQEQQNFSDLIMAAVGKGIEDTEVVISSAEFPDAALVAGVAPVTGPGLFSLEAQWFQWTWRVALVLLAFLVLRTLMRRALVLPPAEEEEVVEIPEASPAERRRQEIAAEVERLSQQEPETVAALLRTWMGQGE